MRKLLATFILVLAPCACVHTSPPGPAPTPEPTACEKACTNLAQIGCPEGLHKDCKTDCEAGMGDKITDFHPDCLAKATSQEEARACKSVHCITQP
ncbi:MAG TPA: hypothetical protein VMS77_09465 [Conexivisphaerales archaeon]|nr:hypothetical protein [Conexivisphaerales archaeon]